MQTQNWLSDGAVCPISGQNMKPWLFVPGDWRRPSNQESFQLYWCQESQLGCLHPLPAPSKVSSFYDIDEYYTHYADATDYEDSTGSKPSSSPSFFDKLRLHLAWRRDGGEEVTSEWFKKHFGVSSHSICEIGCANGSLLEQFRADGHQVWGVEPDPKALVVAERRGINVYSGTAESLPPQIKSRQYDAIIMNHVLEHTLDPLSALRNAMQLLVSGGKLVMEVPNNSALAFESAGAAWLHLDVPRHLYFFTPYSLRAICEKVGFKIIATEFNGYCRQFHNGWIEDERKIFEIFDAMNSPQMVKPQKNSKVRAWKLLLQTMFAAREHKYDSVRIIVEKP